MLVVSGLHFGFRHRPLFQGLDFRVSCKELAHLVGPNGCGKSTLMNIIAGLLEPDKGTVAFESPGDGVDDRRHFLEYLPAEANGLYVKMDAVDNLRYWSELRGQRFSQEDVYRALDVWGLNQPYLRERFPVERFSTGMKRRLAMARLTLSSAPCWLLDEPGYGLDKFAMSVLHQELARHLLHKGMVVVVSHDVSFLEGLITKTIALGGARE